MRSGYDHRLDVHADQRSADVHARRGALLERLNRHRIIKALVRGRAERTACLGLRNDVDLLQTELLCHSTLHDQRTVKVLAALCRQFHAVLMQYAVNALEYRFGYLYTGMRADLLAQDFT